MSDKAEEYYYLVTIETVGVIVRRFGGETASTFEGQEIATSAYGLLAMTRYTKPSVTDHYYQLYWNLPSLKEETVVLPM